MCRSCDRWAELIYKQLKAALDKNNILEIESDGVPFDPNFHNAIMTEKNDDYESDIVIQTMTTDRKSVV